ncbi:fimbrillin family protein [Bacteroides sp. 224]|uniref:fimbrillin family protein n=1 Tax=Bacteroides sp. 224 TaxID=2302936 RepID=UPI0013D48648|nr:fimbrillin family protein [Bacteroides sp. 224]NDV66570.1 hypothetical protein [Bacteroides sp. 224]
MIQRNFLYGLLISVASLSACSNDEIETDNSNNIRFNFDTEIINEIKTRASIVPAGKYAANKPLRVLAVKDEGGTAAAVFDTNGVSKNHTTTTNGANTEVNTEVKWPNHALNFHAFSSATYPASWDVPASTTTFNAGTYTNTGEVDLLYAKSGEREGPAAVELTLNHLLSRITFQIKKAGFKDGVDVQLKKLTLIGAYTKADGSFGTIADDATSPDLPIKASASKSFSWANLTTPENFVLDYTSAPETPVDIKTSFVDANNKAIYLTFTAAAGDGDSWFMLPHSLDDFGTDTKLKIEYTVGTAPFEYTFELKTLKDKDKNPIATPWRMGEWTNYQITINAHYITFNPITVTDWGKAIDKELHI